MIELRSYQQAAIDTVFGYWQNGGGNPLVDLATGLGKSVVIGKLTRDVLDAYPDMRVLMLVHVRELVQQNFLALQRVWPGAPAGIYSAGLNRRDAHHRITFASIQSVFKKASILGPRDLVLIDEAHLVPADGEGMYRRLLEGLRDQRPDMRVAGFTATPFRLDSGRLDRGEGRLFDEVVYSYGIGPGIADGWLSALRSKASATEIDVTGVAKRGGEFIPGALEAAADKDGITNAAAAEIAQFGADRRSWLIFCSGIKHAFNVRDAIRTFGIRAETVTGETPTAERDRIIRDFKSGQIRCLTNAQVLTTGFDAPSVDLIAFLRPTLSTGLYVQMVGRGTRKTDGKANCLILDFAGNVRRHGPVDAVDPPDRKRREASEDEEPEVKVGLDSIRAKECPNCGDLVAINARHCPICDFEWPSASKPKHESSADRETPILSTEKTPAELIPVVSWQASRHSKFGSPDSMRVSYFAGLRSYDEWVTIEHGGFAGDKARRWWARHGGSEAPADVTEALERFGELAMPAHITVRMEGRWWRIVDRHFADRAPV